MLCFQLLYNATNQEMSQVLPLYNKLLQYIRLHNNEGNKLGWVSVKMLKQKAWAVLITFLHEKGCFDYVRRGTVDMMHFCFDLIMPSLNHFWCRILDRLSSDLYPNMEIVRDKMQEKMYTRKELLVVPANGLLNMDHLQVQAFCAEWRPFLVKDISQDL